MAGGGRVKIDPRRLGRLLDRFAGLHVLVVGDVMIDEYLWGDVERVNPEAPVPVVHVTRESTTLGGAGNVVRNLVALGARCSFSSVVGEDVAGDRVVELLEKEGVDPTGLVRADDRPTTRKTRIEARSQQMLRFDRETDEPIPAKTRRALLGSIEAALPRSNGVILEDYAKGMLIPPLLRAAMARFREADVPVLVDPKHDVRSYRGARLLKPNQREVESLTGIRIRTPKDLERAVARLRRDFGAGDVVVTRAGDGMAIFERGAGATQSVPVARSEVFDNQGAGDTCIAVLTLGLLAGGTVLEAAILATAAAGVVVGKLGTATATPDELRALLPAAVSAARSAATPGRAR